MIYTNTVEHGGMFNDLLAPQLDRSNRVSIASGYVSLDIIEKYAPKLEAIALKGGNVRLLVGMAFYEGLSQKKLSSLTTLSHNLANASSGSGVYVPYTRKYHGKIYITGDEKTERFYVGSSNFSSSGLLGNMEATVRVLDASATAAISRYVNFLFSDNISRPIDQLEIVVPGSSKYKQRISVSTLDELERHDPNSILLSGLPYFDLDLERYTTKLKSSLNVYFGDGRLNRATGKITPRPWYETALIATADIIRNPLYPHGYFDAYTDDGYVVPMSTSGDNDKNIQSRGNLKLFGMWLKSRLQASGALIPLTPITLDVLEAYGRSSIRFYKIAEGRYFVDFSSNLNEDATLALGEDGEQI